MKTLINRFFTLFSAFFALFRRGVARDARGATQKPDKMLLNFTSNLTYSPAQMPRKKRPFNNKKQTKGRNFYYDPKTGKKLFHTHSFAMGNL